MKFKHRVYDHKKKVGFDFGGYGPNSLGIRVKKRALISIFLVSRQELVEWLMDL